MSSQGNADERLAALEQRLERLEDLLISMNEKLGRNGQPAASDEEKIEGVKQWVTDFVSMRLQQLVPETCEHPELPAGDGPFLGNTSVRCTEEVVGRVKRIPIPFVREMVVQRVAENARKSNVDLVDVEFFEKAATF